MGGRSSRDASLPSYDAATKAEQGPLQAAALASCVERRAAAIRWAHMPAGAMPMGLSAVEIVFTDTLRRFNDSINSKGRDYWTTLALRNELFGLMGLKASCMAQGSAEAAPALIRFGQGYGLNPEPTAALANCIARRNHSVFQAVSLGSQYDTATLTVVESAFGRALCAYVRCAGCNLRETRALRNELFALMGLKPPHVVWGRDYAVIGPALTRYGQGYEPAL